jgi:predicted TIM-barrel fold metal-dependent hydrolase
MADIHLHYNWNQAEVIDADEIVKILRQNEVKLAVVSSRPSALALKLRQAGGDWILPIFSPYIRPGIKQTWFVHPEVVDEARKALESGQYVGIGEMHLVPGMGPRRDNKVVQGLLSLAREFKVPILIHTDSSSHTYLQPICQQYHDVRILWAHAGGLLQPDEVRPLMEKCPNVWVELSARDPWHYGSFIDGKGEFYPGWYDLFLRYPERFMTGTDPVWNAHQTYRWYEADEGWNHYGKLNQFHRDWMSKLPAEVEKAIRFDNAVNFFKKHQ